MHALIYRLLVLVWFLSYMAAIYLALHMILARFTRAPDSRLAWVSAGTSKGRVRMITLLALVALWLGARLLLGTMGGLDF